MTDMEWKIPIWDEDKGQVIRVFRPDEIFTLIENVNVKDDKTWGKILEKNNIRTKDVQLWLSAALYTGLRFTELCDLNARTNRFESDGNITVTYHKGRKAKASPTRIVYLSTAGKRIIPQFLNARPLPVSTSIEEKDTMTALTTIMKAAGDRVGLEKRTFLKISKRLKKNEAGEIMHDKDGEPIRVEVEKQYTTNACAFRSMRKTWVSWLFAAYQNNPPIFYKIFESMGHLPQTSAAHYLNFRFDVEDIVAIRNEVDGFAVL